MNMNDYSRRAMTFAKYQNEWYPFFALCEEVGELHGKIAKELRGDKYIPKEEKLKELGDILWQLNACCIQMGSTLEEVAEINLAKLEDRAERGVLKGEGDNR